MSMGFDLLGDAVVAEDSGAQLALPEAPFAEAQLGCAEALKRARDAEAMASWEGALDQLAAGAAALPAPQARRRRRPAQAQRLF